MLRQQVAGERQALRDAYLKDPDPRRLLQQHARLIDRTVKEVWAQAGLAGAALVATGGYGRNELYPCSDIDLLVLLPEGASNDLRAGVERLIGTLWDTGLEIGHSVRTVAECVETAAGDITIQTTLTEARFLSGSRSLYRELAGSLSVDPIAFYKAKKLEQEQRH